MGLFEKAVKKVTRQLEAEPDADDHAVLVHFELSDDDYGSEAEREAVFELEQRLEHAMAEAGAGELDGNEFGGGEAVLYLYGPDKDQLWQTVEPLVRDFPFRPAYALLRAGGPDVVPERVDL